MTDETDNTEQASVDFFGESLVVAPRETHSALEAAAQALAEGRVWSLGERTHYGQCARFEIVSATDGRFLARLSGAETWQPRLVVAREEAALDDDLEEATDYVTLNVQYHVRRDGGVDASGVHFRGDDPQQLSNREVAWLTHVMRLMNELGWARPSVVSDGVEVTLRDAPPIDATSRWHDVGRHMLQRMARWARTRSGWKVVDPSESTDPSSLGERARLFNLPWDTGRTVAEDFRDEVALDDEQRAWLEAAIAAWTSFWLVVSVADGRATLRDMFTREVRVVPDEKLCAGTLICARVVTLTEGAYIDARDENALDRRVAADLRFEFAERMQLPRAKPVKPEALRVPHMALELAVCWYSQFDNEDLDDDEDFT